MFKPLGEGEVGLVLTQAQAFGRILVVNEELRARLEAELAPGDWTYLTAEGWYVEIIKIVEVLPDSLRINRGIDGSGREAILAGTKLYYRPTVAGIRDRVADSFSPIVLTFSGVAEYRSGVYIPEVLLKGSGDFSIVKDQVFEGNYNPCKPFSCGGYELSNIFLTTMLYPLQVTEGVGETIIGIAGRLMPVIVDDFAEHGASVLGGTLRLQLDSITSDSEELRYGCDLVSISLVRKKWAIGVSPTDDTYLGSVEGVDAIAYGGDVVSITITRKLVEYENWPEVPDEYQESCTVLSGTLV